MRIGELAALGHPAARRDGRRVGGRLRPVTGRNRSEEATQWLDDLPRKPLPAQAAAVQRMIAILMERR
jgi:hypothetical protein